MRLVGHANAHPPHLPHSARPLLPQWRRTVCEPATDGTATAALMARADFWEAVMKEIHNAIGDFFFDEPDFDDCGGRTFRRVKVPQTVVRKIVTSALAVHAEREKETPND